jgi:hypothetical protein
MNSVEGTQMTKKQKESKKVTKDSKRIKVFAAKFEAQEDIALAITSWAAAD